MHVAAAITDAGDFDTAEDIARGIYSLGCESDALTNLAIAVATTGS